MLIFLNFEKWGLGIGPNPNPQSTIPEIFKQYIIKFFKGKIKIILLLKYCIELFFYHDLID